MKNENDVLRRAIIMRREQNRRDRLTIKPFRLPESAQPVPKLPPISQTDFYSLADVVAANAVMKRTPRGNPENRVAFESIVKLMEQYDIPEESRWKREDY